MNQRKAKQLRKAAKFSPGEVRVYDQKHQRHDDKGRLVSYTQVADGARRVYQDSKRGV